MSKEEKLKVCKKISKENKNLIFNWLKANWFESKMSYKIKKKNVEILMKNFKLRGDKRLPQVLVLEVFKNN